MKVSINDIDDLLSPLLPSFKKDNFTHKVVTDNPPLRSELFSQEQMESHAQTLATTHVLSKTPSKELLLRNLSENENILGRVNQLLIKNIAEKKSISPAAEWLLDNFFLIEEQITLGKRYLPKGYSKGLPKLKSGFPRVYAIVIEIISHSDGHVDLHNLTHFIQAYQKESSLTLGELWAIPTMLRLALIENLSRVAAITAVDLKDSALANRWANEIIERAEVDPKNLVLIIADMARTNPPMVSAFVAEFARKLQWKGPELSLPLNWIEQHLIGSEYATINAMVAVQNQRHATNQVSVSNSINSLRFLTKMDWREVVESLSVVEQVLHTDIGGVYSNMDFYTRDAYRHNVERFAKMCHVSEVRIASIAIDLAQQSFLFNPIDLRSAHVGHYLIGKGQEQTLRATGVTLSFAQQLRKKATKYTPFFYFFCACSITLLGTVTMLQTVPFHVLGRVLYAVLTLLVCVSVSHAAFALTNWWASVWVQPKPLPKLDFSTGIPDTQRTLVAIPTLLLSYRGLTTLLEELEVRFLANRDPNLLFALLTDLRDAKEELTTADELLIEAAKEGIMNLNRKYGRAKDDTFFLFHRPRTLNTNDNVWMGYERKRGKLNDLNALLRDPTKNLFSVIVGEANVYTTVKYVITLDTDTQLPRDAARKLVGLMAHPLNQPVYDEQKQRVIDGYAIIQPRIAISLHGATRSAYTRLHENDSGIDPYTRVTSDIYQDVFNEGSFIGKGIYDVDAFDKALDKRFPDNRILSHDLLEGAYARCGFASDVQLYEEYPSRYDVDSKRKYRWIRGDWQIAIWFFPFVPSVNNGLIKNPISVLSRWKIFDNLRRSGVPIALLLVLLGGWMLLPNPLFWSFSVLGILFLPSLLNAVWNSVHKPREVGFVQHLQNATSLTSKGILQNIFAFVCLPYEAYLSMHAIALTFWRVHISGKKLLEWNASAAAKHSSISLLNSYQRLWIATLLPIGVGISLYLLQSTALWIALPFLVLWLSSPLVVHLVSQPTLSSRTKINDDQRQYLRLLSRKTWTFFESFVTADDHWLPPDNFQEYPTPVIAHRTSPTNIGLSLLANLAATDFGYTTTAQLIERTTNTFTTLTRLDRFQGHFFNWYDTQYLHVLQPRYISTVDSGNFAGHLLTLRQGLLAIPNQCIVDRKQLNGLEDCVLLAIESLPPHENEFRNALHQLLKQIHIQDFTLPLIKEHIEHLYQELHALPTGERTEEITRWLHAFEKQLEVLLEELHLMAPWLSGTKVPEKFKNWSALHAIPSTVDLLQLHITLQPALQRLLQEGTTQEEKTWLHHVDSKLLQASEQANERIGTLHRLAAQCYNFADMQYGFLYDKTHHLLSIGYTVDDHQRDKGFYDLLASEARLGLFVAIAQGKIPQESWFALGRRLTMVGGTPVLLSWSGSMFEYVMPNLVMPVYDNTLLHEMGVGMLKKQIDYAESHSIPWGISESCYNLVDTHLTYQYRAFGIPGLGFKRGLSQDLVIAPYASVLGLLIDPQASCANLERLKADGYEGRYGFYEAIDFTPSRLVRGQTEAVIQTYMAHHQGMSFLSLAHLLLDQPMQHRFEADTEMQTALLLLQERVPKSTGFYIGSDTEKLTTHTNNTEIRIINTPHTPVPEIQLLSNGSYALMLSNAGGGYSRWRELAVTRWREDSVRDNWGMFCYIQDREKNNFWSTAYQPTLKEADQYEVIFSQGLAEFRRQDDDIETYTVVIVSPEDDVEVRRIQLTNHASVTRKMSVTSYAEVVLNAAAADNAHPAFSNLFVQTAILENQHAVTCTRRARSKEENPPWMFHLMKVNGVDIDQVSYETDRSNFIGRGQSLVNPQVMNQKRALSGSQGSVLDPIVSIQYKVTLEPGASAFIDMVTGVADTRESNQFLIDKYQDKHFRDRAFELSYTHSQVVLRQIGASEADAQLYGKLASSILYLNPQLRAHSSVLLKNKRGQSALWSYSISGDLPIVVLQVSNADDVTLVQQFIKAQAYWHIKGLAVDIIIINEDVSVYRQVLQEQIQGLIVSGNALTHAEKKGHIFVRHHDQITSEDRILFETIARVIISDTRGTLQEQVNRRIDEKVISTKSIVHKQAFSPARVLKLPENLQFFNGIGGFSADGKEYILATDEKNLTPLPWINVLANPHFGTIVSEKGSSYTWFQNAHEYRLTPWNNDPVVDPSGEAYYLRDEESGEYWSPLRPSSHSKSSYITKHGFGYSTFEHHENGILSEVCMYVDKDAPIKFVVIKLTNQSGRDRSLTLTGYVEWVLGELRSKSIMHLVTEKHPTTAALLAHNSFHTEFQSCVAFFDVDEAVNSFTTDRKEFIGRNGTLENPAAMKNKHLSGKSGAGMDACAALQVAIELNNEKERTIVFKIGAGDSRQEVEETIQRFKGRKAAHASLEACTQYWNLTLKNVQVYTPDAAINILANGWLLYQVMACRLWARSGFYQSGGAFGFRDQLQDVLAVLHTQPQLTRDQILLSASRQFKEGDVQHWWHPPQGKGVRTLCSDDYLWLPYVTSRYLTITNDRSILEEFTSFLEGRLLNHGEESYYDQPSSYGSATLYEHCKRAIIKGSAVGIHGLPLKGSGDWNDGMNRIGIEGKGESVWLAFFLYDVLLKFSIIALQRGDDTFAHQCEVQAKQLKQNIDKNAWDGEWYLRAYFDDGTPLGSKNNTECKIDAISQSWSVLSKGGDVNKSLAAMQAVDIFLVNREKGIIQLLDPPFDTTDLDPGYIKGYVPGVRENGGQYTHAAIWAVMAFAKIGDNKKTEELIKLINPILHGSTVENRIIYKTEPYVMAADVYGVAPHIGRGGWTWYTGSAGWMYQLIVESYLGLTREGNHITFNPVVPAEWKSFSVNYRFLTTDYVFEIILDAAEDLAPVVLDGTVQQNRSIQLIDDQQKHTVVINYGKEVLKNVTPEASSPTLL